MHDVLFAAMSWDPGFRGILTVVVAVAILCGSVYLLLATNAGNRLGFLLALTGLAGWMFLMGILWSIYGIGRQGDPATWEVLEFDTSGEIRNAQTEVARMVPEPKDLPVPEEILARDEALAEQFPEGPGLKRPNLGDLLGVEPELADELPSRGGWELLPTSDPQTGEAVASATAFLTEESKEFTAPTEFVVLEVFSKGGKERPPEEQCQFSILPWKTTWGECLTRAWFKAEQVATWPLGHPPHYAVVQVQRVIPQETQPGQPPPLPEADPEQPVISVIMERDLGNRRLPSVITTVVSGIIFVICCNTLHRRDKRVAEARAAAAGA